MFTRVQPPRLEAPAGLSVPRPLRSNRARLAWLLKRGAALALLAIGAAALLTNATYVTSDNAVVTAHVVSLRAPIEGVVETRLGSVGDPVIANTMLAKIANPLFDDRQVAVTRYRIDRLNANLVAARLERVALVRMLEELVRRGEKHRAAKIEALSLEQARIDRDRSAKEAELQQLVRDMGRKIALRHVVADSEIEQAQAAVGVAAQQVASFDRQIEGAAAEIRAAGNGVLTEANSANDVAYSDQRADEVRERLADLQRVIAGMVADVTEAEGQVATDVAMAEKLRAAVVMIPSPGMIWRLGAASGERVAAGDLLAQTVDCGAAFLAVDVPQNRLPDIDVSAPAVFRLSGEQRDRSGRIVAITGEAAVHGDAALAATPALTTKPVASVLIAVPPSPNQLGFCLIGRTARVVLPTTGGGWLDWLTRLLPINPDSARAS